MKIVVVRTDLIGGGATGVRLVRSSRCIGNVKRIVVTCVDEREWEVRGGFLDFSPLRFLVGGRLALFGRDKRLTVSMVKAVIVRRAGRRTGTSLFLLEMAGNSFVVVEVTGSEIDALRIGSIFVIETCSVAGADSVVNQESFDVLRTGMADRSTVE